MPSENFRGVYGVASAIALTMALIVPTAVLGDDASGPAVASPNGKISIEGGQSGGDGSFVALGSYTSPLSTATGVQFDGAFGTIDEKILGGGGVHLFTRDPSSYLLGVYGSYHQWNDIEIWRAAAEFEFYNGQFSLSGLAGIESIDVPGFSGGVPIVNSDSSHFFGQADFAYYPTDNLMLSAGYHYLNETSLGAVGIEYLTQAGDTPISLFANGRFGENDYQQVSGGLKVYLDAGPARSLIDRHRVMDPPNYTPAFPSIVMAQDVEQNLCPALGNFKLASFPDCTCPEGSFAGAGNAPVSPGSTGLGTCASTEG